MYRYALRLNDHSYTTSNRLTFSIGAWAETMLFARLTENCVCKYSARHIPVNSYRKLNKAWFTGRKNLTAKLDGQNQGFPNSWLDGKLRWVGMYLLLQSPLEFYFQLSKISPNVEMCSRVEWQAVEKVPCCCMNFLHLRSDARISKELPHI